MKYGFLAPARAELEEAFDYYEAQRQGLGDRFVREAHRTIHRILKYPHAWARLTNDIRRCRTRKFPYGIVYQVESNEVIIIAVMHLSRMPGYWKERLK